MLLPCSKNLVFHHRFWVRLLQLTFMSGINAQPHVSHLIQHPMSSGIARNLMSPISAFLVVRHMFTFGRINAQELVRTWRNAYSSDIHKVIKVGHSTIPLPSEPLSLNELNLMNDTFLASNKIR